MPKYIKILRVIHRVQPDRVLLVAVLHIIARKNAAAQVPVIALAIQLVLRLVPEARESPGFPFASQMKWMPIDK